MVITFRHACLLPTYLPRRSFKRTQTSRHEPIDANFIIVRYLVNVSNLCWCFICINRSMPRICDQNTTLPFNLIFLKHPCNISNYEDPVNYLMILLRCCYTHNRVVFMSLIISLYITFMQCRSCFIVCDWQTINDSIGHYCTKERNKWSGNIVIIQYCLGVWFISTFNSI